MFSKDLLPHDPTGEVATLVSRLDSGAQPSSQDGVWASRDGKRAVLVVQTAGAGSDTDAQARAIAAQAGRLKRHSLRIRRSHRVCDASSPRPA